MEPAEASVSVKVPQVLSEVDNLAKSGGAVPPDQILRKLALAEWMVQIAGRRTLNKEDSKKLEELKAAVEAKRVELEVTKEDILRLVIPANGEKGGSPREDFFPRYKELPGRLVREKILGFLSDPLDKLNLFRAIPSEGLIMEYWDLVHLQFEAIYPVLKKQRVLNWQSIYSLGKVDPFFSRVISNHFKSQMQELGYVKTIIFDRRVFPKDLAPVLDRVTDEEMWSRSVPIPTRVHLDFIGRMAQQPPPVEENMNFLRDHGEKVLDCHLELGRAPGDQRPATVTELLDRLKEVLSRMPNLIHLTMEFKLWSGNGGSRDEVLREVISHWPAVKDVPLPELKSLKSLHLNGSYAEYQQPEIETVKRKMLVAYSRRLVSLVVDGCYLLDDVNLPFPNLRQLALRPNSTDDDFEADFYPYLHLLINSPLQVVHLDLERLMGRVRNNADIFKRTHIPRLLTLLSTYFGKTLEELAFAFGTMNRLFSQLPPEPVVPPTWMMGCEFPQLKRLSMDPPPHPDDSGVLLLFPGLERFSMEVAPYPEVDFWSVDQIVPVSTEWDRMKESAIWKLLPNLKDVGVSGDFYYDQYGRHTRYATRYLTRQQCIAWERQQRSRVPPTVAQLEKEWEVLKMVFPVLVKQGGFDWKVLYQLGRTHPFFQDVIKAHLKTQVLEGFKEEYGVSVKMLPNLAEHTNRDPEWCRRNPLPVLVRLDVEEEEDMRFLREFGPRLWICSLWLPAAPDASQLRDILSECLTLMPNLIRVVISSPDAETGLGITNSAQEKIEQGWNDVKNHALPDLPELLVLSVELAHSPTMEPVKRLLLVKYGGQVKSLLVKPWHPCDNPEFTPRFPNLENLWLRRLFSGEKITDVNYAPESLPFFRVFAGCPLRVLILDLGWWGKITDVFKRTFPAALLPLLSTHFGGTLEELVIQLLHGQFLSRIFNRAAEPCQPADPATWMENCAFPKLKVFVLDRFPHPDDTGFLKCFPHLETLGLNLSCSEWPPEEVYKRTQAVELSYEREKMKGSNIWGILPGLKVLMVGSYGRTWKLGREESGLGEDEWTDEGKEDFETVPGQWDVDGEDFIEQLFENGEDGLEMWFRRHMPDL